MKKILNDITIKRMEYFITNFNESHIECIYNEFTKCVVDCVRKTTVSVKWSTDDEWLMVIYKTFNEIENIFI